MPRDADAATSIFSWPARRPWTAIGLSLLLVALALPFALKLKLDTQIVDLLPASLPEADAFARFSRAFAADQGLIILVEGEEPDALRKFVDDYAHALESATGVAAVRAHVAKETAAFLRDHALLLLDEPMVNALLARLTPAGAQKQAARLRGLVSGPGGSALSDVVTADPLELLSLLQSRLPSGLSVDTKSGYFRSDDGRAYLLYVESKSPPFDVEADRRLLAVAEDVAHARAAALFPEGVAIPRVGFTGTVAYAVAWRDWLHSDMRLSTALSLCAVLLLFALLLRAVKILPLVALSLGFGLLLTMAFATLVLGRINAVSLSFGSILLAIGIDVPIQMYSRLRKELREREPRAALEHTLAALGPAAVVATLGPSLVFFCCLLSSYRGLGELGVLAGAGLLFNLLAMLLLFPALLSLMPRAMWRSAIAAPRLATPTILDRFSALVVARGKKASIVATLIVVVMACGVPRVAIDRHLLAVEPPKMAPAEVQHRLEAHFGTKDATVILYKEGAPAQVWQAEDEWLAASSALTAEGLIKGASSVAALLPSPVLQEKRRVRLLAVDLPTKIARFRAALVDAGFDPAPFDPALTTLGHVPAAYDFDDAKALSLLMTGHVQRAPDALKLATYLYLTDRSRTEPLLARLHALGATTLTRGIATGTVVLDDVLHAALRRDLRNVAVTSVFAVALLLGLHFRRARPFFALMLPLAFAWIVFLGVVGYFAIPLNLFNLLVVPLVIGYGIDDMIFVFHAFVEARKNGATKAAALAETMAGPGRAILVTSLATACGLLGLVPAHFAGLRLLGLTGALAVAACLVATFAVLPLMLLIVDEATD